MIAILEEYDHVKLNVYEFVYLEGERYEQHVRILLQNVIAEIELCKRHKHNIQTEAHRMPT